MILFVVVAALAFAGWRWGPAAWARAELLYYERKCLAYTAPAEQVVFDTHPARVAELGRDSGYTVTRGCAFRNYPAEWGEYNFSQRGRPPNSVIYYGTSALIFLHELRSHGGVSRLVAVERTAGLDESACFIPGYDVQTTVIEPAGLRRSSCVFPQLWSIDVTDSVGPHTDIRIFAGQLDPSDASHFTIRYESRGITNTVDGLLKDDGQLELTVRPFPEK